MLIGIALPQVANLPAWFRAFLIEIHEADPGCVPRTPPRLSNPSDWYTPEESELAARISEIGKEVEQMVVERESLQVELLSVNETADCGIRQVIWADGDDLVVAVENLLTRLGFAVRNMDSERDSGEPKCEDLRLTVDGIPDWEAMVEVKGYTRGTRTNDARQIREHRERYIAEKGRAPSLTLWIANPHREMDPSLRPAPDGNVRDAAETIGVVYVLTTDLYLQWSLVAHGRLDAEDVVGRLINANPGTWAPPASSPAL